MKYGCLNIAWWVTLSVGLVDGFVAPRSTALNYQPSGTARYSASTKDTSDLLRDMRAELARNEEANLMMQALRGQNMNDDDAAMAGLEMQLVDIVGDNNEVEAKLPYDYDPEFLKEFFRKRPRAVIARFFQLSTVFGDFVIKTIFDKFFNRLEGNPELEVQRAAELRDRITSLGPFYIKIGQALSIRPDVLSPRSMVELQKLCDKVPSFDSKIAFATIERELGKPVDEIFSEITPEPVAAASLGQVYKAVLRETGETVAVKVQRPQVLETVSLDLYLARELGFIARKFPALVDRLDVVALLDEFAYRFYQELDYNLECENGIRIKEYMNILPMVVIPKNYPEYTSRRVHVAEWVVGEKLSQSRADDVSALVNLGVITYLSQLLDSGFFHADPHPGNMLRTEDGKLAILDFGLMTEITDDQKYGMVEAIAHLINRDYTEIGQDFKNLDFIPPDTDTGPIVPALTKVFDVALAGGGAKSINFQELAADLAEITFEFPFRIPPYFALVIRAISVLEGIALVGNANFAIIDEAFPYIAQRLLTDKSPRLRKALRYMVYGREGEFDAEKLIDLLQALEKFSAVRNNGDGTAFKVNGKRGDRMVGGAGDFRGSQKVDTSYRDIDIDGGRFRVSAVEDGKPVLAGGSGGAARRDDRQSTREALRFFFGPDGEVFREFMLEEIVTVVDASGRQALHELVGRVGLGGLPQPSLFRALNPELSEEDRRTVRQIGKLIQFLLGDFEGAIEPESGRRNVDTERLRGLIPVAREYAPQLREFGTLLIARLTEKNLSRGLSWVSKQLGATSSSRTLAAPRSNAV